MSRYSKRYGKKNRWSNRKSRRKNKSKSKYHELERAAYQRGQVERGLANPESRIFESYQKGLSVPEKRQKKPLF